MYEAQSRVGRNECYEKAGKIVNDIRVMMALACSFAAGTPANIQLYGNDKCVYLDWQKYGRE